MSFKMPLVPPAPAAALGKVNSSQWLPKSPPSSFPAANIQKAGPLVWPSLKCAQVLGQALLLHPRHDGGVRW